MSCSSTSNVRFQLRRATEAQWISANPNLLVGEPAFSTDTLQLKIGNGSAWSATQYINLAGGVGPAGTPTTLQTLILITTATGKSGTTITLGSQVTFLKNQPVAFSAAINDATGGDIVPNTIYYIFENVTASNSIKVSETINGPAY